MSTSSAQEDCLKDSATKPCAKKQLDIIPRRSAYYFPDSLGEECDLIELVNELQNKLAVSGSILQVPLPQIIVVGCQSAGKSSVIEGIVGKEFLPRGTGVVTRRPTVVQLLPCEEGEECAIFLHKEKEKFTNFEDVKTEIYNETLRELGPTVFSSKPISLKIFIHKVLKLTLVDLPGIIKNVFGDEPETSIQEVRSMIIQYIEQPNSLILAVTPANQDIANSDALNIAKEVDPKRRRTIGVLTKLDLMDVGTNACDILENKKIFLKRGYVGVLNRSQKDIDEHRDIEYSLEKQKKYFATTQCYRHMSERMGIPYLRKILNHQLRIHIKESLPSVRKELCTKLSSIQQELKKLEQEIGFNTLGTNDAQFYLIKLVQQFIDDAMIQIYGHSDLVEMRTMSVGALINFKLYTELQNCILLPPLPTKEELTVLIANMHGIRNTLNVPSQSLEAICRHLVSQYKEPLRNFVADIAEMIMTGMENIAQKLYSFRNLHTELLYFVMKSVQKAASETKEALENHLNAEMFFVNIYHDSFKIPQFETKDPNSHPDYLNLREEENITSEEDLNSSSKNEEKLRPMSEKLNHFSQAEQSATIKKMLSSNQNAQKNCSFLEKLIHRYMRIERKQIGDTAIKYMAFFLVKRVMDFLKIELIPSLLQLSNLKIILAECEEDFRKREEMLSTCSHLEDALGAVQYF